VNDCYQDFRKKSWIYGRNKDTQSTRNTLYQADDALLVDASVKSACFYLLQMALHHKQKQILQKKNVLETKNVIHFSTHILHN